MKNVITIIILSIVLSASVFAGDGDGIIPIGGKTCPNGQTTCLIAEQPEYPAVSPLNFAKIIWHGLPRIL